MFKKMLIAACTLLTLFCSTTDFKKIHIINGIMIVEKEIEKDVREEIQNVFDERYRISGYTYYTFLSEESTILTYFIKKYKHDSEVTVIVTITRNESKLYNITITSRVYDKLTDEVTKSSDYEKVDRLLIKRFFKEKMESIDAFYFK